MNGLAPDINAGFCSIGIDAIIGLMRSTSFMDGREPPRLVLRTRRRFHTTSTTNSAATPTMHAPTAIPIVAPEPSPDDASDCPVPVCVVVVLVDVDVDVEEEVDCAAVAVTLLLCDVDVDVDVDVALTVAVVDADVPVVAATSVLCTISEF